MLGSPVAGSPVVVAVLVFTPVVDVVAGVPVSLPPPDARRRPIAPRWPGIACTR